MKSTPNTKGKNMNHEYIAELDGPQSRIENKRRILAKGGGATSTTVNSVPKELKPLARLYTRQATNIAKSPFKSYKGNRYADLNKTQNMGLDMVKDRAMNGDPLVDAGSNFLQDQLQSGPRRATKNPYGNISYGKARAGEITPGQNAYAGPNPYLDAAVRRAQGSVVDQFNNMTKPQTEAAMRNSGSFGNSGLSQLMGLQQKAAAEQMSDIASGMYMQDYGLQQGLAENAVNRDMDAQQYNADSKMGTQRFNIGNSMNAKQFNANMGNDWAGRNDSVYQNYIGNNLNATQQGLQYGNNAYHDAGQLLSAGGLQQQNTQNDLDFKYDQFQNKQDDPYKKIAATGSVVSGNMGSKTTQSGGGK